MAERYDSKRVVEDTMKTLKDFQRATVDRVIELYAKGTDRVLVADEVGLGKTVVARGVIARFAELREQEGDDLVKVAYICSNQNIVRQNVQKLRVASSVTSKFDLSESRLSMQHLCITEQEYDPRVRDGYVQIIPLTPETSFRMTSGLGLRRERALIYVILERMLANSGLSLLILRRRLYVPTNGGRRENADDWWRNVLADFRKRIRDCEKKSRGAYPANLIHRLDVRGVREIAEEIVSGDGDVNGSIRKLRRIFAEESAAMLHPDLVVMDEFQRFRYLINSDADSDMRILVERFLFRQSEDALHKIRVLLLSATPYKLYSTAEEIAETGRDDPYREFDELLGFLYEGRSSDVRELWKNYTYVLREGHVGDEIVLLYAKKAEAELAQGICRTERIAVMEDGDYISDSSEAIEIASGDVASYVEFSRMLEKTGMEGHLPVDYVKSCPYLMSYLRGYKIKERIENSFRGANKKRVEYAVGRHLWLRKSDIDNYRELPKVNARLESLKGRVFPEKENAALYMWIPPILPYYPLSGVYRNAKPYSKILVFSAWEMVPRMIATLLSYEAERRTVGGHLKDHYEKKHHPRMKESVDGQKTAAFEALVEPDKLEWLVGLWNPVESMNAGLDLPAVERSVREKVRARFGKLSNEQEQILIDKAIGSPAVCIARRIGLADGGTAVKELAGLFYSRFNLEMGTAIVERAYERRRDDDAHWRDVLRYCKDGCFQAMFDEYYAVLRDEVSFLPEKEQREEIVNRMKEALPLRTSTYEVDTFKALHERIYHEGRQNLQVSMRTHFAVGFAKGKGEQTAGIERKEAIRKSFNSPLRPFVLASTSIGQEGLDFHPYCRKIFHWNLPSNPVDLEQREGRINRYKCLAVRANAALLYFQHGHRVFEKDVWREVYEAAERDNRNDGVPELIPFWCFGKDQQIKIERIVPKYPCSRDEFAYDRLIKILSIYRLSIGQPRQEELIEHILRDCPRDSLKGLKKLFLNLCPYLRGRQFGCSADAAGAVEKLKTNLSSGANKA